MWNSRFEVPALWYHGSRTPVAAWQPAAHHTPVNPHIFSHLGLSASAVPEVALRYAMPGGMRYRRGISGANITQIRYAPRRPLYVGVDRDLGRHLVQLAYGIPEVRDQLTLWLERLGVRSSHFEYHPEALLCGGLNAWAQRRVAQELHLELGRKGHDAILHHHRPTLGPPRYSLSAIFPWPEKLNLLPLTNGAFAPPGRPTQLRVRPPTGGSRATNLHRPAPADAQIRSEPSSTQFPGKMLE